MTRDSFSTDAGVRSPSLIPKPADWGSHISVNGFSFLPLASQYVPEPALEAFLNAGPTPIYVGFGSIIVDDPNALLQLVFEAVRRSGQRAVISSGWGGLNASTVPEGVIIVDNVPHDWLFARVSCVVHHGGASTTAAGIRLGKPTVTIPFFGDQFFWGSVVARAGAGPSPIPFRELKSFKLVTAIEGALSPTTRRLAQELGRRIEGEQGAEMSALSFQQHLNVDTLRCSLDPSRNAVWKIRRSNIRVSAFCATVLIDAGLLRFKDLNL
jgi:UDP:flavonoid glycosyltransferase YjiC (YdhE family)